MNLKIEIVSAEVRVIKGKRKADGADYEVRKQEAFLHSGHHYPDRFELSLGKDDSGNPNPPYPPGFYTLAPASIGVNREYGNLEISPFNLRLLRLEEPASKPVKAA